jgi:hypothetical protein
MQGSFIFPPLNEYIYSCSQNAEVLKRDILLMKASMAKALEGALKAFRY